MSLLTGDVFSQYVKLLQRNDLLAIKELLLTNIGDDVLIYKYCNSTNQVFENLKKNSIWMSNVLNFNDPYDCCYLINYLSKEKYKKEEEPLAKMEQISQVASNKFAIGMQKKSFASCFSETNNSNLMWSHYANNHIGFVLCYKLIDIIRNYDFYPVIYQDSFEYSGNDRPSVYDMLIKSTEWSYEKEWRLIEFNDNHEGKAGFLMPLISPVKIIFGARYPDYAIKRNHDFYINDISKDLKQPNYHVDENIIIRYCKDNNIEIEDMKLNPKSFVLQNRKYNI